MKLITIIVPVYNVEKYLEKCVDSIIKQTYKNLEIILIDDGSTDNSGKICDKLKTMDNRIVVYHKKNGGLSSARNFGISMATGEYIGFVDSDDYIDKYMYEKLYNACIENDSDISMMNKARVYSNKVIFENIYTKNETMYSERALLLLLLLSDPSSCNKLYKKSLFNKIKFPEGKLYEDIATIPYVIDNAKLISTVSEIGYYYVQRENSIINNKFNAKKMDYIQATEEMCDYIKKKYKSLIDASDSYQMLMLTVVLTDIYPYRKEFKKEFNIVKNKLKKFKKIYKKNKYIPFAKKIMIFLDLHNCEQIVNLVKKLRNGK